MYRKNTTYIDRGRLSVQLSAAAFLAATLLSALPPGASGEVYLWPLHGNRRLSSSFSEYRDGHYHAGIDLRSYGAIGLPCLAVSGGEAVRVKVGAAGYGKALYVRLEDGRTAVYAHLDQFNRTVDSIAWHYRVSRETNWCDFHLPPGTCAFDVGDTVGFSGETGTSAPHLHFELRDEAERPLNPLIDIYSIPDGSPPIVSALEIIPLGIGSMTEEGPLPAVRDFRASGSTRFILPDTLHLDGAFGFAVSTWDEQGYGSYRMAPVSIELAVDGQMLYSVRNEVFSYSQADGVSAEYDVRGDGPAARFMRLFPVRGSTRTDRSGPGVIHTGQRKDGMSLRKGLHIGLITVRDASGNSSSAIFHFSVHDFPVINTARRLDAAPEVVISADDPDGGDVHLRLSESFDGGDSWNVLFPEREGEYFRAAVTDSAGALYRVEATDDEGATIRKWFASPQLLTRRDMAFASLTPETFGEGVCLRVRTDAALAAVPDVAAGTESLEEIFQTGIDEYVALNRTGPFGPGSTVFTLSGVDYRGFPVHAAKAARIFTLRSGGSARFTLADSMDAGIEGPSLRRATPLMVSEVPMPGAVPAGLVPAGGPFSLDFQREDLSKPMRLYCEPGAKTGLFIWKEEKGWKCVGVPAMEGGYVSVDRPGTYIYLIDGIPPLFDHVSVEKGHAESGFFKPYFCSVPVTEDGTGIDPWAAEARLGGERVVCEWDEFRKRLVIPVPAFFPAGRTVISIDVSDRAGNRSVGEFGFVIE
jgi:hypothetical protein